MNKLQEILQGWRDRARGAYRLVKFRRQIPLGDYLNLPKLSLFARVFPYTAVNYARLNNVYTLAEKVSKNAIEGAFVECGVWRGGCSAVMATIAERERAHRCTYLFDSFQGMPEAGPKDASITDAPEGRYRAKPIPKGVDAVSTGEVAALLFRKLKLAPTQVKLVEGWFQDTVPQARRWIGPIAILRLDGDNYESTKVCLEHLYDNVVAGGYVIIDDFGSKPGCRIAVDEFRTANGLSEELHWIDRTAVFFKKSSPLRGAA